MTRTFSICVAIAVAATVVAACSQEKGPDTVAACKAQIPSYDAKDMKQCVSACKACENGVTTTCTTSCTLKGAR
jgi:hypothetical protein